MGMLLITFIKTQLSLLTMSSLMFLSSMRQVEVELQEDMLFEAEGARIVPVQPQKVVPAEPQEKEEE